MTSKICTCGILVEGNGEEGLKHNMAEHKKGKDHKRLVKKLKEMSH